MELLLLKCPCCMNTSYQTKHFLDHFVLETVKQMQYGGLHQHTPLCLCFHILTQESALFMDKASSILRTLSRVASSFNDEQQQLAARRMLEKTHRPQNISTSLRKHDSVMHDSVTSTLTWVFLQKSCCSFTANRLQKYHSSFVCLWLFLASALAYKWRWTSVTQSLNVRLCCFSISWNTQQSFMPWGLHCF